MAHLSIEELEAALERAAETVVVGGRYAHYKHPELPYRVTGLGVMEANDGVCVFYRSDPDGVVTFVRPLESWCEPAERDGAPVERFTRLTDPA